MTDLTAREIRGLLQDRLEELLERYLPGGVRQAGTYVVRNPTRDDRKPGSFMVWTRGDARGGFREYAAPEAKGDVIDLIAYLHGRQGDRKFALAEARRFLGIDRMAPSQVAAERTRVTRQAEARRSAETLRRERRRKRANAMWARLRQRLPGTLADTYLRGRGIELEKIPQLEDEARFAPAVEWWLGAEYHVACGERFKAQPGPEFPAIVNPMRDGRGVLTAVHITFLKPDGTGKADVDRPKLMFGDVQGAAIRISRGPSGKSWEEAGAADASPLIIPEGFETGLSVAFGVPEARVVAAGSVSNIGNVPVDHPCVSSVFVAAENDQKPAAVRQLEGVIERLELHGKPVEEMRPHLGSDFNDLFQD